MNAINVMRGASGISTYQGLPEQEAEDQAEEAGLAGTVTPLQIKQLTRRELEADPGEQASFAPYAFQIVSFEHQGKNRNKSGANYERASVAAD